MKLNLRPLPYSAFSLPDVLAVSYETEHEHSASENTLATAIHDFNIALYRQEKLLSWVQLCPCNDKECIEFRNKFINEEQECTEINERVLHYAEQWAVQQGYKKIIVNACQVSIPYYLRMQYKSVGEPFLQAGSLMYKLVKTV